jgi:hypothetical protein
MNFLDFPFSSELVNLTSAIPSNGPCSLENGNQSKTGFSTAACRSTSQESHLSNISVTEIAQESLSRSKSDDDLRNTKVTFLAQRSEAESKLKSDLETTKTSEGQLQKISGQISSSNNEFYQKTCTIIPRKKPNFRIKSGREIPYSKRAPSTGLYNCIAPFFETQGYVGVFLPQNRDRLHSKDFERRTFKAVCFKEANHPIANLSSMLEKMIRGITWQNMHCPVDSYQMEEVVTSQKHRVVRTRIREAIVTQYEKNVALKYWVGAVKQFDAKFDYSNKNFVFLFEKENLPRELTSTFIPTFNPIQSERLSNSTKHPSKEESLCLDHSCSTTNNSSACDPIDDDQISHSSTHSSKEECGNLLALIPSASGSVCEPIDDHQANHSSIPSEGYASYSLTSFLQTTEGNRKSAIDMFPEHRVRLENQLTKEDFSRLTSMGTLAKNPTFTAKNGREFYNSKVTIKNFYDFFLPYFEELNTKGIFVVERSDTFYTEDFEGQKSFTAVCFKEDKSIANTTSTLSVMMKKISWRTCLEPILSYQTAEKSFKSDKDKTIRGKIDDMVATMYDQWGFVSFLVGNVKEFDPDSEYHTYILLFNQEKR